MKELIKNIAHALVDNPEKVTVSLAIRLKEKGKCHEGSN